MTILQGYSQNNAICIRIDAIVPCSKFILLSTAFSNHQNAH